MDCNRTVDVKPRIGEDLDKIKSWNLADIVDSAQLKALKLPDTVTSGKVGFIMLFILSLIELNLPNLIIAKCLLSGEERS